MSHNTSLPSSEMFLKMRLWSVQEACLIFTESPKHSFGPVSISGLEKERDVFYHPKGKFNPASFGKNFQLVYSAMISSVVNGELPARSQCIKHEVFHFVKPIDAIDWALRSGLRLPKAILGYLHIKQKVCANKYLLRKVIGKIVAQFLLNDNPKMNVSELIQAMKEERTIGELNYQDSRSYALRRSINELFEEKGKPGRQSRIEARTMRKYTPAPISEIVKFVKGGSYYDFQLLDEAMRAIAMVISQRFEATWLFQITSDEFVERILSNDVVKMHLEKAPVFVKEFIIRIFDREFAKLVKDIDESSLLIDFNAIDKHII